jgi:Fe-S-cluster containining protein
MLAIDRYAPDNRSNMAGETCSNCNAACCKGPLILSLTQDEREVMLAAKTELVTIVEPASHDQPNALYPAHEPDPDRPGEFRLSSTSEPLAAGYGRYIMSGKCGNLAVTAFGMEYCKVYEDRPKVCRDFQMGAPACIFIRSIRGPEAPTI